MSSVKFKVGKRCWKVAYRNKTEARKAMRVMQSRSKGGYGKASEYRCRECGMWHWGHRI